MRRTPVYDPFDDRDDLPEEAPQNVRRISTTSGYERPQRRGDVRPLRGATRRPPPRRGPDPRVWFVRGAIGVAALAGLWLGLQTLFPVSESQVSQAPAPTVPTDASAVGAPEPPAGQAIAQPPAPQTDQPAAQVAAPAPPVAQPEPQAAQPEPQAAQPEPQAAQPAAQAAPEQQAAAPAPPAPTAAPIQVEPSQGDRLPGMAQQPAQAQPVAQAPAPEPTAAPQTEAREEAPSQQPVGKPTIEPIPPPPGAAQPQNPQQQAAQQAAQQAVAAAPKPQAPAPKPQAPAPPPAQATGGPFELAASASPVNPISENAVVTITVRATQNGAAVAGASCMATVYYRTNTARQPQGGFRTNGNGVGSFTLDARGATYGHYIPVDVVCNGRGGAVTARTGFTPVRGR